MLQTYEWPVFKVRSMPVFRTISVEIFAIEKESTIFKEHLIIERNLGPTRALNIQNYTSVQNFCDIWIYQRAQSDLHPLIFKTTLPIRK